MSPPRPAIPLLLLVALAACGGRNADVVLYCAVDQEHSEPIVRAFEQETGLTVDFTTDIEANKSIGLRRRLQEESNNVRCDVFWNNEAVQTVLLADAGVLDSYVSPSAADIPERFKDPEGRWTGFAARGRVIIVNTESFPDPADRPATTEAFVDPRWSGRCGMARPLTGTTATHASVWIQAWGQQAAFGLLQRMRDNDVRFGPGNAQVMRLVRERELDFGWTDTDDVRAAVLQGFPVQQVVPDQDDDGLGLILIPNTVSLVKDAPHPEAARRLIDFLLSRHVEQLLAEGLSAQIPVRNDVPRPDHVLDLTGRHVADVDWNAVGRSYTESVDDLEAFFNR